VEVEIDPASASARTQELVDAAAVVADTILVTPSLVHGEGEVTIRLRPTVLGGSEIRLEAKGEAITVALTPATVEVQRLAEQSQARFAAELSERIPSFQIAVVINPRPNVSRRDLRDETA
jgi:flagellar hook-length control protein FliK